MVRRIEKKGRIKEDLRQDSLLKRKKQTQEEIGHRSRLIKNKLFKLKMYKEAETIMFYVAKSGEVETERMIKESLKNKKKVVIPKVKGDDLIPSELLDWDKDLETGSFGIKEPKEETLRPISVDKIDIVIVPGICFDLEKNRVGYGKGYFDRFLSKLSKKTKTIGIAFDSQIVKDIPRFSHEQALDMIITEKRMIE